MQHSGRMRSAEGTELLAPSNKEMMWELFFSKKEIYSLSENWSLFSNRMNDRRDGGIYACHYGHIPMHGNFRVGTPRNSEGRYCVPFGTSSTSRWPWAWCDNGQRKRTSQFLSPRRKDKKGAGGLNWWSVVVTDEIIRTPRLAYSLFGWLGWIVDYLLRTGLTSLMWEKNIIPAYNPWSFMIIYGLPNRLLTA